MQKKCGKMNMVGKRQSESDDIFVFWPESQNELIITWSSILLSYSNRKTNVFMLSPLGY